MPLLIAQIQEYAVKQNAGVMNVYTSRRFRQLLQRYPHCMPHEGNDSAEHCVKGNSLPA